MTVMVTKITAATKAIAVTCVNFHFSSSLLHSKSRMRHYCNDLVSAGLVLWHRYIKELAAA